MRCKRHTVDFTSNLGGVCASCLRERLLSLAAHAAAEDNNSNRQPRKSNKPPPLLIFPRSVSPYVTGRKSDAGGGDRRFLAAPQVDLGFSCKDFESHRSSKSKGGKASRISNLFRARSEDYGSDRKPVSINYGSDRKPVSRFSCDGSESSWFSSFLSTVRSKKQPTTACYVEDAISGHRRPQRVFCRGMSPARDENEPPSESVEETPRRTPATKTPGRTKIVTGMRFCLSPLVRAKPHCPFKRKTRFPSEVVGSAGEVTVLEKPHIAEAVSFCANRSKKLVDLGRVHHRR
ncbi:BnaC04g22330D [Brassica napus]|uniref:(rape) hypothetical protein n=1 Tax=Brassica napus TaxID=3708 RepID=A0A078I0Q6_BRANA|nr:uncharacterized protein LOC106375301 [Brassica napus]CAF1845837.1 unnamed protein product [Brassica napus]CDY42673.1 BnaC04g22330D [Brassica napus]